MEKQILTAAQVCKFLGIGRATLWRYTNKGIIPQPQKGVNGYNIFWFKSDIEPLKKKIDMCKFTWSK